MGNMTITRGAVTAATVLILLVIAGCSSSGGKNAGPTLTSAQETAVARFSPHGVPAVTGPITAGPDGLSYIDVKVGTGAAPSANDWVTIKYSGWLENGASFTQGAVPETTFRLGERQIIPGVEQALKGMHVGGRRRAIIPPELGYGDRGLGDSIAMSVPPKSTLWVDITLVSIGPRNETPKAGTPNT